MRLNQNTVTNIVQTIVASTFLITVITLPQAGFSQQSPGAVGVPQVDEPNSNSQINDPSRPINEQNPSTSEPNADSNNNTSMPNNQMNTSGYGSGGGAGGSTTDRYSNGDGQFSNRIERYTNDPNATNTRRNVEYLP